MRVGEPPSTKIWHRVCFAPDHIIQNPEIKILQNLADTENIVIAANNPYRTIRLENTSRLFQPCMAEGVIGGECVKLVPRLGHRINMRLVWTREIAAKLKIIRRISEDKVNRLAGDFRQLVDALPT